MELAVERGKMNILQVIGDYGRQLFSFIRSRVGSNEDAEDILQDVWHQLSSQARLDDIKSISGWLYRVAKNRITDSYRKRKTIAENFSDDDEDGLPAPAFMTDAGNNPETAQLQKFFREVLFEALEELPEKQRNVFVWNELEDISLQEIAERENENIKTIISRKRYAVQHLKRRLEFLYNDFLTD